MSSWMSSSLQPSGGVQASMPHHTYIIVQRHPSQIGLMSPTQIKRVSSFVCCRFGNTVVVHFEDMAHANLDRLLSQYRGTLPCFSDDVQVRMNIMFLPCCLLYS